MVSQIQLGNFFSANGKTVLGGISGSGLDTESLIKGLTEAKALPAKALQDKIDLNDKRSEALAEFKQLLGKFKDATNFLRNPPGVGNAGDNVFKYTSATVTSNTTTPGSSYLSVTASPGTALQSYTINEITSIAQARKQSTGNINIATADAAAVSDTPAAGQFKTGTFTLKGEDITFEAGDSLNTVAAKFNAVKDLTGISASIIKVSTGVYQLSFSATATGTDGDFDFTLPSTLVDPDDVFDVVTIVDGQPAANAVFKLNNVEITRQGNSINDVVDGVTFTLLQEFEDPTSVTVSVKPDEQIVKNGILNLVNAYNDLKLFAAEQTQLADDGTFSEESVLSGNQLFRNTINSINSQLSSVVAGIAGSNPSRLADIGITFADLPESKDNPQVRNILNVDEGKLASAISTNPEGVRKVFEFDLVSDNSNLRVFSRTNAMTISEFSLYINPLTSTYEATYDNGSGPVTIELDGAAITGDNAGYTLTGRSGTVLEGLVLIYSASAEATIEVTATQGLADKVFNISNNVLKENTGSLAVELESIKTSNTKLDEEIARIDLMVEKFREELLRKFGALEQVLSRINTLLQSIDAQNQAQYGSD